jgi:acetyl-CoA acyltransferase
VLAPNIAREVSLIPHLPKGVQSWSVSRACASANQAITDAADQIVLGTRTAPLPAVPNRCPTFPFSILADSRMPSWRRRAPRPSAAGAGALGIRPRDLVPITPAIAEPTTGETMGESAEKMAKINHIAREDQDQFALRSHRLAHAGTATVA